MCICFFFFFNDTATTEIYTLSLHDALPICFCEVLRVDHHEDGLKTSRSRLRQQDRKSTRLNSSHSQISYAVFCLKKKKKVRATILLTDSILVCVITPVNCSSHIRSATNLLP